MRRLLSLREAADVIGCHWKTVSRLVHEGAIPARKIRAGRTSPWRVEPEAIDAWMAAHRPPAADHQSAPVTHGRLLRARDVCERIGVGPSRLYALVRAGQFPRAAHLGALARWSEREVQDWIAAQIARRDERRTA
jgi:prophage regulatory protein